MIYKLKLNCATKIEFDTGTLHSPKSIYFGKKWQESGLCLVKFSFQGLFQKEGNSGGIPGEFPGNSPPPCSEQSKNGERIPASRLANYTPHRHITLSDQTYLVIIHTISLPSVWPLCDQRSLLISR